MLESLLTRVVTLLDEPYIGCRQSAPFQTQTVPRSYITRAKAWKSECKLGVLLETLCVCPLTAKTRPIETVASITLMFVPLSSTTSHHITWTTLHRTISHHIASHQTRYVPLLAYVSMHSMTSVCVRSGHENGLRSEPCSTVLAEIRTRTPPPSLSEKQIIR